MTARYRHDGEERLTCWLNEARRGNKEAFGRLCGTDSWQRWLIGIACSLPPNLRSKVDPEDVLTETLEQAWRDIGGLKDVSTQGFHRWIAGISRPSLPKTLSGRRGPERALIIGACQLGVDRSFRAMWTVECPGSGTNDSECHP